MKREAWWLLGALGVIFLVSANSPKGKMPTSRPDSNMDHLQPRFAAKIVLLLAAMRARGFDPLVWETARDDARTVELAKEGTGVLKTLHNLKPKALAVDIIDRKKFWENPAFFTALGEETLKLKLYRVRHKNPKTGRMTVDGPHVQAIPPMQQEKYLAATPAQRDSMLAKLYLA